MGRVACVGVIDKETGASWRLMPDSGPAYFTTESAPSVGTCLVVDVLGTARRETPHVEDVRIGICRETGSLDSKELARLIVTHSQAPVWRSTVETLFDGRLERVTQHSLGCVRTKALPACSTGFWVPPTDLVHHVYRDDINFQASAADGSQIRLKYVGLADAPGAIIPAGAMLRVSLARWWAPSDGSREEACHLQLSGMIHRGFGLGSNPS